MKTKFIIDDEIRLGDISWSESRKYYEKKNKKYGFILDKENREVFKEYDRPIILNEGDSIAMDGIGYHIVSWKSYDVDNDIMIYLLE